MTFHDLSRDNESARVILLENADARENVKPVVDVIAGRRTHDDLEPEDWIDALEAAHGAVAVYFEVAADHEWWLAHDADPEPGEYDDEHGMDGPYHTWTSYPSGGWDHSNKTRAILQQNLEDLYWTHSPEERCDIYRSKVVPLRDAPKFVQEAIGGNNHV